MSREMINILGILITHPHKRKIVDWGWIIPRRCPFLCPKLFNLFQFVSTRKLFFFFPVKFFNYSWLIATNWLQTFLLTQVENVRPSKKDDKIQQKICTRAENKKILCLDFAGTEENCLHGSWLKVKTHLTAKAHTHSCCWCAYSGVMWHMFANHKYLIATCGWLCVYVLNEYNSGKSQWRLVLRIWRHF